MTRRAAAVVLLTTGVLQVGGAAAASGTAVPQAGSRTVVVVLLDRVSFASVLDAPVFDDLANAGGAALLVPQGSVRAQLPHPELPNASVLDLGGPRGDQTAETFLAKTAAPRLREAIAAVSTAEAMVVVAGTEASAGMIARKDGVLPAIVATGTPARLMDSPGAPGSLTSDSTRRSGVVSSLDLAPTIDRYLGAAAPTIGSPIRVEAGRTAPIDLYERYLQMRRLTVPIQAAAMVYVMVAGIALAMLVPARRRIPATVRSRAAWLGLSVAPLATALLLVGHLPTLTYATVVPSVLVATVAATLAVIPTRRHGALVPPMWIGLGVLVAFAAEGALGFSAALTPLLGGSELDGGRFFGLPNVYCGLLVGAGLYFAQRLSPWRGVALLCGIALFIGLPQLGANVGDSAAAFAAAGLWLAVRRRGRLDVPGAVVALLASVAGTTLVLLAHRYLAGTPTHATRFLEGASGGVVGTAAHRLGVGVDLIARAPFAIVPTVGVFVVAWVALRPTPGLRPSLHRHPAWRDAVLVTALAGIVALLVNDSGPAAAGLDFGLAVGGLLYVSLTEGAGKMGEREPAATMV